MSVLLYVFAAQAIVIGIILVVLKGKLNDILIDSAVKQVQTGAFVMDEAVVNDPKPLKFIITTHKTIKDSAREQLLKVITKAVQCPHTVDFKIDAGILGGVIIQQDQRRVDCSLTDRLRQAFGR